MLAARLKWRWVSGSSALRAGPRRFSRYGEKRRPRTGVLVAVAPGHFRALALMREIFEAEAEGERLVGVNDAAKFLEKFGLAVRGEAHHFVFVAEFPEAEILRERGVIHSERMRKSDFAERAHVADLRPSPTWNLRNRQARRQREPRRARTAKRNTCWRDGLCGARCDGNARECCPARHRTLRRYLRWIPAKRFITRKRSSANCGMRMAKRSFVPRRAKGSRGTAMWSTSESFAPARSRQNCIARDGNPAAYFTRLRRSSSTAAMQAAVHDDGRGGVGVVCVDPKNDHFKFIPTSSLPRAPAEKSCSGDNGCVSLSLRTSYVGAEISLHPLVQHVKTPRTRPSCTAPDEILPHGLRESRVNLGSESWRPVIQPCRHALAEVPPQPIVPRKCEGSLRLRDDFLGHQIAKSLDQKRLRDARHRASLPAGAKERIRLADGREMARALRANGACS